LPQGLRDKSLRHARASHAQIWGKKIPRHAIRSKWLRNIKASLRFFEYAMTHPASTAVFAARLFSTR
jgi:hypothetical protein